MSDTFPVDWSVGLNFDSQNTGLEFFEETIKPLYETQIVYPSSALVFQAFEKCSFENTKVVILGQDPYHGAGQANGLSFSVGEGLKIPPSLRNIFKELRDDVGVDFPGHGDLSSWAEQGVLLMNATLTVEEGKPGSHQKMGWELFTDSVIAGISKYKTNVVFILWGAFAQQKEELIDTSKHFVLKSPHPSPFSARKGFFGSKPFSKTNVYLSENQKGKIDWQLPMKFFS